MKSFLKYPLYVLAAVLLVGVALTLYLLFGDLSVHRDRILAAASDATGFEIASDGAFDLEIGREISLSATQVVINNPGWPDVPSVATVGELHATVDTRSLVSGPIDVVTVRVSNADINLIEGANDSVNWIVPADPSSDEVDQPARPAPIVRQIVLNDIRLLHQVEGSPGTRASANALQLDRSGPNQFDMHIDMSLEQGDASGTILTNGSLQFGDSLTDATNLRVDFDTAEIKIADTVLAKFSGFAAVDISAGKPIVDTTMNVSSLEVKASTETRVDADEGESDDSELLFSTDALAYSWLNDLNLDADIRIEAAAIDGNAMSNIRVAAAINDGALKLSPVELKVGDGNISGSLELVPVDDLFALNLDTEVDALSLAQLAGDDQDPATVPPLGAQLTLTGQGASLHDILASSNGRFSGRHDGGQLKLRAISALFSDFLTSILRTLNPLAEEQTYMNLECGIYEIRIADGVAAVEQMLIQSERLTIVSSGNVDLGTETIDLVMRTKTREGLGLSVGGVSNSFVKLGGTLKAPSLNVDAAGTVTTAGAAVATGGLSVLAKSFWDRLSGEVDLCGTEQSEQP